MAIAFDSFFIFILLSLESSEGAMRRTNPDDKPPEMLYLYLSRPSAFDQIIIIEKFFIEVVYAISRADHKVNKCNICSIFCKILNCDRTNMSQMKNFFTPRFILNIFELLKWKQN